MTDLVIISDNALELVRETPPSIISIAEQGPRGADGSSVLVASTATKTATEITSAFRVLILDGQDNVLIADNRNALHRNLVCGVSENAAIVGDLVVVRRLGELTHSGWAWTPGLPIFLDITGHLTQVPPAPPAVFSQMIAVAMTGTKIFIDLQAPIIL